MKNPSKEIIARTLDKNNKEIVVQPRESLLFIAEEFIITTGVRQGGTFSPNSNG